MPEPEKKRWQGAYAAPERVFRIPQAYFLQNNSAGKIYRLQRCAANEKVCMRPARTRAGTTQRMRLHAASCRRSPRGLAGLAVPHKKKPTGIVFKKTILEKAAENFPKLNNSRPPSLARRCRKEYFVRSPLRPRKDHAR